MHCEIVGYPSEVCPVTARVGFSRQCQNMGQPKMGTSLTFFSIFFPRKRDKVVFNNALCSNEGYILLAAIAQGKAGHM